jgi:polysaccharide chain length determinant protein (PEP-CTERM system associated)
MIHRLGLFSYVKEPRDESRLIQSMQKSISIEVVDSGGQRLSAFKIAYLGPNPAETAKIANALASMVIDENLKAREQQFSGTEEFLESELQDTKKQLEQKETEVQRIKSQYVLDLPESKQYHLEALANLRNQLHMSEDRVARAQQQKIYLQSLLATTSPAVDIDADVSSAPGTEAQLQKLETRLAELRARYGPSYPDVRKLQAQLEAAKAKASQDEQKGQTATVVNPQPPRHVRRAPHNPVVEAEIAQLDQEIDDQVKQEAQLNDQINFHASKLEHVPVFEQQVANLMRDYDTLRNHYNRLLDKKLSAEMATQLENRQKGERFVILDPAPVPTLPFGPKRGLISIAGFIGGLFGGLGLAMLVEMMDESVRSEREAAQILGKTVLAGIPQVLTPARVRLNRLRITGAITGTAVASAGFGFLISYVGKWIL